MLIFIIFNPLYLYYPLQHRSSMTHHKSLQHILIQETLKMCNGFKLLLTFSRIHWIQIQFIVIIFMYDCVIVIKIIIKQNHVNWMRNKSIKETKMKNNTKLQKRIKIPHKTPVNVYRKTLRNCDNNKYNKSILLFY